MLSDFPAQFGAEICCGRCMAKVRTKMTSSDVFTWASLSSASRKTPLKSVFDLLFDLSCIYSERGVEWKYKVYNDFRRNKTEE